jgi:hypothetical protein
MTIKWAEITIVFSDKYFYKSLWRYIGRETVVTDKDIVIIEFADGTVCDMKDDYVDKKYNFAVEKIHGFTFINSFTKEGKTTLYYRKPYMRNNVLTLDFNRKKLYKNIDFDFTNATSSKYTMIYEDINKNDIVTITKIKSSEESPRFLLTYKSDILDKSDIIYLVNCIFTV